MDLQKRRARVLRSAGSWGALAGEHIVTLTGTLLQTKDTEQAREGEVGGGGQRTPGARFGGSSCSALPEDRSNSKQ